MKENGKRKPARTFQDLIVWQKAVEQDMALLSFFVNDILPAVQ